MCQEYAILSVFGAPHISEVVRCGPAIYNRKVVDLLIEMFGVMPWRALTTTPKS